MTGIPLAQAIGELRSELADAMVEGADKTLLFEPGEIELELKLQIENKT